MFLFPVTVASEGVWGCKIAIILVVKSIPKVNIIIRLMEEILHHLGCTKTL